MKCLSLFSFISHYILVYFSNESVQVYQESWAHVSILDTRLRKIMHRTILHIDFDSFFASCEQQFHPQLRNRPIGVTARNGRTCIIAASREAKRLGIKTAMRSFDAETIYPGIILVPAHFTQYYEISKQFLAICKEYAPVVELFSIDEVFMDVTHSAHLFGGVMPLIARMKKRLAADVGAYITASFGIAQNKLLAKLASGLEKPSGVTVIGPEDVDRVYRHAKLTDVCGIGERVKRRLHNLGVYALLQLRDVPEEMLVAEFGRAEAAFLKDVGFGRDNRPVLSYTLAPTVKSISRDYCLAENQYNQKRVLQNIYELCEELGIKLRRLGKKARAAGMYLRGNTSFHVRKTHVEYSDSGNEIYTWVMHELHQRYGNDFWVQTPGIYVRQICVWVGALHDASHLPLSLFETTQHSTALLKTIDTLNERFGDHTIRRGYVLYADKLTTEPNGWMADTYERTKLAQEQQEEE